MNITLSKDQESRLIQFVNQLMEENQRGIDLSRTYGNIDKEKELDFRESNLASQSVNP